MIETLRRILVATDGSANGSKAVSFAVALSNEYDAKLELCYALDYARAFAECSNVNGSVGLLQPLVHELEESAKSILADAVKLTAAAGLDATSSVLDGNPPEAIAASAKVRDVDAIVIGTTGKRGLQRFFLGSVAGGVLQRSDVPTFVVPSAAGTIAFKRFLVAVDESEPSDVAAAFALDLAKAVRAQIIFVGVTEIVAPSAEAALYDYDPTPMREGLEAKTASRLAIETDRALANNVVSSSVVSEGAPAERILDLAQAHDVDLIVVGTHGRRGLQRLLLGSVAEAIVSRSHIPVAVVPARRILEDIVVSRAHDHSESSKAAKASALTAASK